MTARNVSRGKNWCFTLNNYSDEDSRRLLVLHPDVLYVCFGKEVGELGTLHLQGFVAFRMAKVFNVAKAFIGNAHISLARNVINSIAYCEKEGDFHESGARPAPTPGRRTDLDAFKDAVKGGMYDIEDIREHHSAVYARFSRFCLEYINQHKPAPEITLHPLRGWQQDLNASLNLVADFRTVVFIVDPTGNAGKSWFAHYYARNHVDAQVLLPGKKADMCFALRENIRVLFVDAPRSKQGEFIQYDFLEDVKNGFVFSPKYESRAKRLGKCHVVVLMNEDPDMTKLSLDRYDIIRI